MATARLRRTFQYPAESDDDDAVEEGMDEQDQETLISTLSQHDTSSTTLYTRLLLILPLAPVALYLPRLLSIRTIIPSLAAIASLFASAYILYFLPLPPVPVTIHFPDSDAKTKAQSVAKGKSISRDSTGAKSDVFASPVESRHVPYLSSEVVEILRKYIITANGAITVILAMAELMQRRTWSEGMMIGGGYVPAAIFVFILWARRELRVVDLGELERLRYRAKGI